MLNIKIHLELSFAPMSIFVSKQGIAKMTVVVQEHVDKLRVIAGKGITEKTVLKKNDCYIFII